ncbi:chaperone [Lithospermum erythrorhizon]|uniref:Chaperone n=1 Tax=Lithospermum erythrorhizon TaxID=34254 RepID=A0AAV3RW89_LITER
MESPSPSSTTTSFGGEVAERRGIPSASFVEDVQTYLNQLGLDATNIRGIEKCLYVVATLQAKKGSGEWLGEYTLDDIPSGPGGASSSPVEAQLAEILQQQLEMRREQLDMRVAMQRQHEEQQACFSRIMRRTWCRHGSVAGRGEAIPGRLRMLRGGVESVATAMAPPQAPLVECQKVYSRALIEDSDSVCLWLGANVMLEYSCEEMNLENAKASLEVLFADLQFLRDQVTITQVLFLLSDLPCHYSSCLLNWDVHQRRIRQTTDSTDHGVLVS